MVVITLINAYEVHLFISCWLDVKQNARRGERHYVPVWEVLLIMIYGAVCKGLIEKSLFQLVT